MFEWVIEGFAKFVKLGRPIESPSFTIACADPSDENKPRKKEIFHLEMDCSQIRGKQVRPRVNNSKLKGSSKTELASSSVMMGPHILYPSLRVL